jgi:hypothetical protein
LIIVDYSHAGWQKNADGPVPEDIATPDPKAFYDKYVVSTSPVVLRGAVTDSPATQQWAKDDILKKE